MYILEAWMRNEAAQYRIIGILVGLFFVFGLGFVLAKNISATTLAADLSTSTKKVNNSEALPGGSLRYTIVVNNSGDTTANNVVVTDTLPTELTYDADSLVTVLSDASETSSGVANDVVSWNGSVDAGGSVKIIFNSVITDSVVVNDIITNTVDISGDGSLVSESAATTIVDQLDFFFPIVFKAVPSPVLNTIASPGSNNQWTVSWQEIDEPGVTYELEEDNDSLFSSPDSFDNGTSLTKAFNHSESINNTYCYRVRALVGTLSSEWSNVKCVVGAYYDSMSSSSGWAIRQEDTDDANNESWYQDGNFILKIRGRWDFSVASPLRPAPEPPYEISARIRTNEPDNLNSYGLIFGGDWDGSSTCPTSEFNTCFNHYYRLNIIWYGSSNKLRIRLKRIDYHDEKEGNAGRGPGLFDYMDVKVGSPPEKYVEWRVQVLEDGTINIYANNKFVTSVKDTRYINDPYFGIFAATDEYLGSEPWVDWYRVAPLD